MLVAPMFPFDWPANVAAALVLFAVSSVNVVVGTSGCVTVWASATGATAPKRQMPSSAVQSREVRSRLMQFATWRTRFLRTVPRLIALLCARRVPLSSGETLAGNAAGTVRRRPVERRAGEA